MSDDGQVGNRLWVQVRQRPAAARAEEAALPAAIAVDLVASGVGAIVKSAADRLVATDQWVIRTVLAYEPAFAMPGGATAARFLVHGITLNVGPKPVPLRDERGQERSLEAVAGSSRGAPDSPYARSPVVIGLELAESADGTALTASITHWKYAGFLDPSPAPFRRSRRKVTVEVKISDPEGSALLKMAMQVEADAGGLAAARPNDGERLPWMRRPVKNFPGERAPGVEQTFGPVNVEASITEVAEPSAFAKVLGAVLGNQKAAVEKYVRDRVGQALDETEAAKARLDAVKEASTARAEYDAAWATATEAKKVHEGATGQAREVARQALQLKLVALRQKEILARAAFDRSGLPFAPLPAIPEPG